MQSIPTRSSRPRVAVRSLAATLLASVLVMADASAQTAAAVDVLRQQFPSASIDSTVRADAALAATNGAKARVEKDYKAAARECIKKILVNACLDEQRALQRKRLGDIDAVELEANRYKRKDRADRLEADRDKREAERAANATADAELRAHNRKSFEDKQAQGARDATDRVHRDTVRSAPNASHAHKPAIKVATPTSAEAAATQRAKNVTTYESKVKSAQQHQREIERRGIAKAADRQRRAEAKAAKDAKAAAASTSMPSLSMPKP